MLHCCNRDNFESARGLTQHQNRSKPKWQNHARLVAKTTEDRPINLETDLINFVAELQAKVRDYLQVPDLLLATTHKRNGTIFRGHPRFRGNVWRDWVLIDWGDEDGVAQAGQQTCPEMEKICPEC